MPRCASCGTVSVEGTHFCPRCGASVTESAAPAVPPMDDPDPGASRQATPAGSAPPQDASQWAPPAPGTQWQQQAPPQYGAYGTGYGAYGYQAPVKTNGMAIASLVLGIVWLCGIGSILAVVFGYMGKNQIDRSGGAETGRGLAIAGIVLGWIGVGFLVLGIILSIIGAFNDNGSSSQLGLA